MQFHQVPGEGESQAQPGLGTALGLNVGIKYTRQHVTRNSDAGIAHPDQRPIGLGPD